MDNNMVSKILFGMYSTDIQLQHSKSPVNTQILNAVYIRTHTEEKTSKTSNIIFAMLPFSHKIL